MERFSAPAVVLSTLDYGEADRLVTLLTQGRGKVTAFAAGARKSRRRFAGALEPGTLLNAQLVERRGSTVRLDAVDIIRSFHGVRTELAAISRALYCLELCRELTREGEPAPELFGGLVSYLERLDDKRAGPTSLLAFELEALALAGLMPCLDRCAICQSVVGEDAYFAPEHGGVVCQSCHHRVRGAAFMAWRVVEGLAAIQAGEQRVLAAEIRKRSRELLNLFISHHLGRRLKSVEFMEQVGLD